MAGLRIVSPSGGHGGDGCLGWPLSPQIRQDLDTIQEEALEFAGIPLSEPTGFRDVEPSLGILKSPATAKVLKAFVTTPPPGGMHRVFPGDKLFLLTVWSTPSISRELPVNAPVGGLVERVLVKAGDSVGKDQELVRLRDPFQEDPWPYTRGCLMP